jgi:hypothetical protein
MNLEHSVLSNFYSNACVRSPYFYIVADLIFLADSGGSHHVYAYMVGNTVYIDRYILDKWV